MALRPLARLLAIAIACSVAAAQPMFDAVRSDSMTELKAALKADPGALDTPGPGGQSPLMNAVLTGKANAVKYLLRKGADTSIAEKDGYTPMHGAGFQGRSAIAKILIIHGLDPFDVHKDGSNPMQRACWGGEERHAQTVEVFADAGATAEQLKQCKTSNSATKKVLEKALQALGEKAEL